MTYHYLLFVVVVSVFVASASCGSRHHRRDHDDDHQRVAHRSRDHHDPHQYFFAKVHRPSPFGHPEHPSGHGMGHGFQRGYGMHGYDHGAYGYGHFRHASRKDHHSSSDEDDDTHHRHHRQRHDRNHQEESTEESTEEEHEEHGDDHHDDRVWRFQVGDNTGGYEYIDNDGHAKGFHVDLMKAVCRRAGKRCYFLVDTYHHCWNTRGGQELPGIGLLDHYYDGCIGNMPTPDRLNSFNFTLPFSPNFKCGLLYKPGTDHTAEQAHNVTNRKIGFVDGWAMSKRCFERQDGYVGNTPGQYNPVLFETHKAMLRALLNDDIDAVLTVDVFDSDRMQFSLVEPKFSCTSGGSSVMTMYGSEVLDWWNAAFQGMKDDGSFRQLCVRAIREHGDKGRISCLYQN